MNYRQLGTTGIAVSEIGFGAWGLGGDYGGAVAYGPTDENVSRNALAAALESGINFFDTADLYGFGHSESLIGDFFQNCREKLVVATKGGFCDAETQSFTREHLRQAFEASLSRLRTDYIDLYQLHSPSMEQLRAQPEPIRLLKELQQEEKIRAWGISARSPDDARIAIEEFDSPVIQINFNLTDQRARENGLFELCLARQCGVIIRTPLCFGFLTGAYTGGDEFNSMDHRSRWPAEQVKRWSQATTDFQQLLNGNPADTPCQLALRYCLSFSAVSSVIPGMLTPTQVQENVMASDSGPLQGTEIEAARLIYSASQFFVHPVK